MIVAVDGPAGSGKSSVCARVCDALGWSYVNTGFLYRSVAYLAITGHKDLSSEKDLAEVIDEFARHYTWDPLTCRISVGGKDITDKLHSIEVSNAASRIAKKSIVRDKLLPLKRELSLMSPKGAIVDGRDIGTVVFPDADLKIFLTASIEERAKRRKAQLESSRDHKKVDLEAIKMDIAKRDEQDCSRGNAPLKQADDAVVLDTSSMAVDLVVERMLGIIKERHLG